MKSLGFSVNDVAKATGLSSFTICRYLAGQGTRRSTVILLEQWYSKNSKVSGSAA